MTLGSLPKTCAVLVVDDDAGLAETLQELLRQEGYDVEVAVSATEAVALQQHRSDFAIALVDLVMPGTGGLALMEQLHERNHELAVIIMTGYGTIETAVEAMKKGAEEYITKPFDQESIRKKSPVSREYSNCGRGWLIWRRILSDIRRSKASFMLLLLCNT